MSRATTAKVATIAVLVVLLLTFPLWTPQRFWLQIGTTILIFAIFAMSLDVLVGYAGMPSLGHAAFFGTGAYVSAIVAKTVSASPLVSLPAGIAAAAVAALVVGVFSVRSSGIFFLMLTLAFAQMFHAVAFEWTDVTGGSNGYAGVPRPDLGLAGLDLIRIQNYYVYVAVLFLAAALVLWRVTRSPYGLALVGVRENERRLRALGYDTRRLKLTAFTLAGAFAGLAGTLFAAFNQFVSPNDLFVTTSITGLVMVLVGGAGTLVGPVVGAALVEFLQTVVSSQPVIGERWESLLGLLFIVFVLAARQGIVGLARRIVA